MGGAGRTGIAGDMTTLRGSAAEDLSADCSAQDSDAAHPSAGLVSFVSSSHPAPHLGGEDPPDKDDGGDGNDGDAGISVKTRAKTKKPSLYKVLMLNDDYTPMEFVVYVLQRFFGMDHSRAVDIMLTVHNKGVAVVGVYPYEVAETKVMQVMDCARSNQHPLQCTLEKE